MIKASYPTNSLLLYYKFNNTINDDSGNGYNLTNLGTTSFSEDRRSISDRSILFSVSNVGGLRIPLTDLFGGKNNFSVGFWVKVGANGQTCRIIADSNSGGLAHMELLKTGSNYQIRAVFQVFANKTLTGSSFVINTWVHGAFTYDGVTMKLYINSILYTQSAATGAVTNYAVVPCIGSGYNGVAFYNQCKDVYLDNVFVYDRALTETEIKLLYSL